MIETIYDIKISWSTTKDFYQNFSPLILEYEMHAMTLPNQLSPKKIANLQKMTALLNEF